MCTSFLTKNPHTYLIPDKRVFQLVLDTSSSCNRSVKVCSGGSGSEGDSLPNNEDNTQGCTCVLETHPASLSFAFTFASTELEGICLYKVPGGCGKG